MNAKRWHIFAKVVDNLGDAGVAWRLARALAHEHGLDVTFFLDDTATLARFVPGVLPQRAKQRVDNVLIVRLQEPLLGAGDADVVVEAFGCGVPDSYASASASRAAPPQWFVLEYLSAEPWVDAMHGLPSPHPQLPLPRRFWFPGFTAKSGGLLRERGLFAARDAFQSNGEAQADWWASIGIEAAPTALRISLFCYPNVALPALLDAWAEGDASIVCFVAEGVATSALDRWASGAVPHAGGPPLTRGRLRVHMLPLMSQDDYDKLLWGCDVNFVRGEDSFVRAQWAARPFVWHTYPQEDGAHLAKLRAFIERYVADLDRNAANVVWAMADAWNGASDAREMAVVWPEFASAVADLTRRGKQWAEHLASLPELAAGLVNATRIEL